MTPQEKDNILRGSGDGMMRHLALLIALLVSGTALADSSSVTGTGSLSASASIDFRIRIPPKCWIDDEGNIQNNFGRHSKYICQLDDDDDQGEDEMLVSDGYLTIASP